MTKRKSRPFIDPDSIFARTSDKDNFWRLNGKASLIFGGTKKQRSQRASYNIAGWGKPDKKTPQISGSGERQASYDISGARSTRGGGQVADISGAGSVRRGVPDIGGAGRKSRDAPDIGGKRPDRKSGDLPQIGGAGRRAEGVPDIGGDGRKGSDAPDISGRDYDTGQAYDISGAIGTGRERRGQDKREPWTGRIQRSISAYVGFRSLSDAEERELDLFIRRAHAAGFEVPVNQILSWRADLMLDKYQVGDLWKNDVGAEIERKYGTRGENLDLPEADRPATTVVKEKEPRKQNGIRSGFRTLFQRAFGKR